MKTHHILANTLFCARSLLFVPANRPDRFEKAAASGADAVVLDLEDSVADSEKTAARHYAQRWIREGNEALVRVNAVGTEWHADDVNVLGELPASVMLPKSEDAEQVATVAAQLSVGSVVVPLIETARGVLDARLICSVPAVVRPAFGHLDLAAELGVDPGHPNAFDWTRSQLVLAAAAAGCAPPIDGVTTDLANESVIRDDVARAVRFGLTAKLCIHPNQIGPVHDGFAPSDGQVVWAKSVIAASSDGSVVELGGEMVDRPVWLRAKEILRRQVNRSESDGDS